MIINEEIKKSKSDMTKLATAEEIYQIMKEYPGAVDMPADFLSDDLILHIFHAWELNAQNCCAMHASEMSFLCGVHVGQCVERKRREIAELEKLHATENPAL